MQPQGSLVWAPLLDSLALSGLAPRFSFLKLRQPSPVPLCAEGKEEVAPEGHSSHGLGTWTEAAMASAGQVAAQPVHPAALGLAGLAQGSCMCLLALRLTHQPCLQAVVPANTPHWG